MRDVPKAKKTVKGRVNRFIDDLIHPCLKDYQALIVMDGLLHAMVEQDPEASLRKLIGYRAPKLLKCLVGKRK